MIRWLLCAAFTIAAFAASLAALADQTGYAYDEIRWHGVNATPLPPGSFQSDRAELMKRVKPADVYPDLHGNIKGNLGASPLSTASEFTGWYRYSYFGEWIRVDDLIAQTATISRPDLSETIYLNLKTKTYHMAKASPPPMPMPAPLASPSPSPSPSASASASPNYHVETRSENIASMPLEGLQTTAISGESKVTTVNATSLCVPFEGSLRWLVFQADDFAVPLATAPSGSTLSLPQLPFRCDFDSSASTVKPPATLVLYESIELAVSMGPIRVGPITTVVERGSVLHLSASDRSLFEIPLDFQRQSPVTFEIRSLSRR